MKLSSSPLITVVLQRLSRSFRTAQSKYDVPFEYGKTLLATGILTDDPGRWGQTYILEALMSYVPQDSADASLLADRITPRLSHSNSAVVLTCTRVILYLMNYISDQKQISSLCRKLSPPLVTLLAKGPEVQYLALRNALLILQRRPEVLRNDIRVFFCKYNDPIYVKVTKLELIFMLASEKNIHEVLTELREYVMILTSVRGFRADASPGMLRKSTYISCASPFAPSGSWRSRSSRRLVCVSTPCWSWSRQKFPTLYKKLPLSFETYSENIPTNTNPLYQHSART